MSWRFELRLGHALRIIGMPTRDEAEAVAVRKKVGPYLSIPPLSTIENVCGCAGRFAEMLLAPQW